MTDRERLAELLWDRCASMVGLQGMSNWNEIHDRYRGEWREVADAVLAAIGDRLLPEVPDTCYILMATQISTGWNVELIDEHPDNYSGPSYRVVTHDGTGPTIPAAIRKALASQPEANGTYGITETEITE